MAKLSTMLNQALNYSKNKKQQRTLDNVTHKLQKAVLQKRARQASLKKEMEAYLRRFLKPDARSRFIPEQKPSSEEISQAIREKFGRKMALLDVYLLPDLTIEFR